MRIRPYNPTDSLAIAIVKAYCDVTDPLALYCRRLNPLPEQQQRQFAGDHEIHDKQWNAYIKSTRRSLGLELLFPGTVCWVIVLDENDEEHHHGDHRYGHDTAMVNDSASGNKQERIVGFAIWNRHGTSREARKWKAEGSKLSTRLKLLSAYTHMTLSYPFDTSLDHAQMAKFYQRIRSSPPSAPSSTSSSGSSATLRLKKERWELEALYIHPQYQRHGYGVEALRWGIEIATQEKVEIWVWSTSAGKRVYLKSGFEIVGRIGFEDLLEAQRTSGSGDGSGGKVERARDGEGEAIWVMVWRPPE